jgi:hypothetical protein
MPAGSTYTPIATTTITGSSANSYTFSSIPSTYTDLVIVASLKGTPNGLNPLIEFNGDTTPNTSTTSVKGNGTTASSSRTTLYGLLGYINSANFSTIIINVQNYSNATTFKTTVFRWNTTADETGAGVILWDATPAAINAIKIKSLSGTDDFAIGSTLTLYGIAAA